jgi:hypothetical protein
MVAYCAAYGNDASRLLALALKLVNIRNAAARLRKSVGKAVITWLIIQRDGTPCFQNIGLRLVCNMLTVLYSTVRTKFSLRQIKV